MRSLDYTFVMFNNSVNRVFIYSGEEWIAMARLPYKSVDP